MQGGNKKDGFTLIELLVTVVVAAILVGIISVSYRGVQARGNDAQKAANMTTLARLLEKFYIKNGYYPPYEDPADTIGMGVGSWRRANITGDNDKLLWIPGTNYVTLHNTMYPDVREYGYHNGGAANCDAVTYRCKIFRLYWRNETDNSIREIKSTAG